MAARTQSETRGRLSRRQVLGAGALGLGGAGFGYGAEIEPTRLEVTEHLIPVPALAVGLEGFTVAQLTDVHVRSLGRIHQSILEAVETRQPQLVVLTGDTIDAAELLPLAGELCRMLVAKERPVVATLGNWEYWGRVRPSELAAVLAANGGRLLLNQRLTLAPEVELAATDDFTAGQPDLSAVVEGLPSSGIRLLLTHSPAIFDRTPKGTPRFDLSLAGHTHGGQIRFFNRAPYVPPGSGSFVSGMYETSLGRAYVSRGIGTSVLPIRLMCRPELPIFRFVRA